MWTNIWKKKPGYCSKSNNDLKKNQGVQQKNELDTEAELEVFPGQAIKKKKKSPPPPNKIGAAYHTDGAVHGSLTVFSAFFSSAALRGSRSSPLPPKAGLRLLGRPFLPPLAYTAS